MKYTIEDALKDLEDIDSMPLTIQQSADATKRVSIFLTTVVRERDDARLALSDVVDANYGTSFHHIGDGDGLGKMEADFVRSVLDDIRRANDERA